MRFSAVLLALAGVASATKQCLSDGVLSSVASSSECVLDACTTYADAQAYAQVLAERDACMASKAKKLVAVESEGSTAFVVASLAMVDFAALEADIRTELNVSAENEVILTYSGNAEYSMEMVIAGDKQLEVALMLAGDILPLAATIQVRVDPDFEIVDEATCSSRTCEELGWPDEIRDSAVEEYDGSIGVEGVCGSVTTACVDIMSYEAAEIRCLNMGARLCTSTEYENFESAGGGCGYDSRLVWTSTACADGARRAIVLGINGEEHQFECLMEGETGTAVGGRCCADNRGAACHAEPECSANTCEDLGWAETIRDNASVPEYDGGVGAFGVCGSLTTECIGQVTYTEAADYCAGIGARVCTLNEYEKFESAAGGCGYDSQFVWTSTQCADGKKRTLNLGINEADHTYRCVDEAAAGAYGGRCCADHIHSACFPDVAECSVSTCEEFGWADEIRSSESVEVYDGGIGINAVCGSLETECTGDVAYAEAAMYCAEMGARLCTEEEYSNFESAGGGCGYDRDLVWTSTSCGYGFRRAFNLQINEDAAPFGECVSEFASNVARGGRCCADHAYSGCHELLPTCSASTCEALGWSDAITNNNCCEEYDGGLGKEGVCGSNPTECVGELSYADASAHCTDQGARLCTLLELEQYEAAGLGCGYDGQFVWSSTGCGDGGRSVIDVGTQGSEHVIECLQESEATAKGGRCCADVEGSEFCN